MYKDQCVTVADGQMMEDDKRSKLNPLVSRVSNMIRRAAWL